MIKIKSDDEENEMKQIGDIFIEDLQEINNR